MFLLKAVIFIMQKPSGQELKKFSNLIGRDILYIPVFEISAHICKQYCLIRSDNRDPYSAPLTLLWFEETFFQSGHYQSITPTDSSIIMKHYNRMNNSTCRLFESQVVRITLRSVNSDVEQIQQPEIHSSAIMQVTPTLPQERLDQNKPSTQYSPVNSSYKDKPSVNL